MIPKFKSLFIEALRTEPVNNWDQKLQSDEYLRTAVELMGKIEELGGEALIVGGAVRDILLNKTAHDIDIAGSVSTNIIQKHFKTVDIGRSKEFGIVSIQYNGFTYEYAEFREDKY